MALYYTMRGWLMKCAILTSWGGGVETIRGIPMRELYCEGRKWHGEQNNTENLPSFFLIARSWWKYNEREELCTKETSRWKIKSKHE